MHPLPRRSAQRDTSSARTTMWVTGAPPPLLATSATFRSQAAWTSCLPMSTPCVAASSGACVRVYLTQHAEGVSAAVICGTGQQPPALARAGNALCRVLARLRGEHFRSRLIHELVVGAYGRAIKGARTPYDWLSTDPAVVEAYRRDPLCGQMFTVGGYAAVTELAATSQRRSLARRIPRGLPLLFHRGLERSGGGLRARRARGRKAVPRSWHGPCG